MKRFRVKIYGDNKTLLIDFNTNNESQECLINEITKCQFYCLMSNKNLYAINRDKISYIEIEDLEDKNE